MRDLRGPAEHLDHVRPLIRGGTDHPTNLQPLCAACNLAKGDNYGSRHRPFGRTSRSAVRVTAVVRGVLNTVPITVLLLAAVALTIAAVVGAVWLVRRTVPSTREGFHAEISAPMLGVVAALFGLLLAFVIITAYENFLEASADVDREADSLASIVRDSSAFPRTGR